MAFDKIVEDIKKCRENSIEKMNEENFNAPEIGIEINRLGVAARNIKDADLQAKAIEEVEKLKESYQKAFDKTNH